MRKEIPEGLNCVNPRVFEEGSICPDLDESVVRSPKCRKFGTELGWTVSGRVLKCHECLDALKEVRNDCSRSG